MSKELRRENRGSLNSGSSEQCGSRMNDDQELIQVQVPFADGKTKELRVGQRLLLNGVIYGARDAAHLRLIEVLEKGEDPPVDLRLQVIYYVGPTPPQPGRPCGAAGPTTSSRMDRYTPQLLEYGVRGLIGKGRRSPEVINAIKKHGAVYLAATGGAGALIGRCIKEMEVVAYPDLGPGRSPHHCREFTGNSSH